MSPIIAFLMSLAIVMITCCFFLLWGTWWLTNNIMPLQIAIVRCTQEIDGLYLEAGKRVLRDENPHREMDHINMLISLCASYQEEIRRRKRTLSGRIISFFISHPSDAVDAKECPY